MPTKYNLQRFTFTHGKGARTIIIEGTDVIPEYPIIMPLLALTIIVTFGKIFIVGNKS